MDGWRSFRKGRQQLSCSKPNKLILTSKKRSWRLKAVLGSKSSKKERVAEVDKQNRMKVLCLILEKTNKKQDLNRRKKLNPNKSQKKNKSCETLRNSENRKNNSKKLMRKQRIVIKNSKNPKAPRKKTQHLTIYLVSCKRRLKSANVNGKNSNYSEN